MTAALEFRDVDIVFPKRGARPHALGRCLAMIDEGADRAAISKATGAVLGAAKASLVVDRGEISVLMGLSGSGKSTLLRAANGLNRVARGQVLIQHDGRMVDIASCDVRTLRDIRRYRIAMVFQQFGLLPWRTVRENVGFGLELRGVGAAERRSLIDEKLSLVGLEQWADRYAGELSGGMQQRVGLARAFATDADILLMDEPFSALDPLIRGKLQDELLALQAKVRKTILFVSHDLDEAIKLGDRITIMEGGRIVQSGTADDIIHNPADAYIAEFVAHMNPLLAISGGVAMRALADLEPDGGGVWLDRQHRYRLDIDGDELPRAASFNGRPLEISPVAPGFDLAQTRPGLAMVPVDSSLKLIGQLCRITDHPVLLAEDGRVRGVCANGDIVRALARSPEDGQSPSHSRHA
jgi:glycine betaine/proline transport system ATP-binding protein